MNKKKKISLSFFFNTLFYMVLYFFHFYLRILFYEMQQKNY